ncbi:MAG: hypothetical protein H7124_16760 [Phycisphaerales bacterium]|nr:hypothetical protein [Hyphomonadaceae bacterium]
MAKKKYRSLPKRIAGVKIPKALRRYADTPLGAAIIAETLVEFGKDALGSPAIRHIAGDVRRGVGKAALGFSAALQHAAHRAGGGEDVGEPRRGKKRGGSTPRLDQEEMAH